ncbi:efflux RND transporter periplasmic adaptor subunit [Pseudoroseicyclus tamaricis]|uniref:HlyD family efflux transporter periplasmic adaptor subunit n=1 Tax=Pseudoroseicyclus tamaricis TaxID=2705421 RepID=A0A6B2JNF1_9RHOB|nr:HlyD family efflux transporter periplasmic adaptor subunit [Pseudoroseicyclus tamaricis]NDU99509.1 HlyD family efflux transporter periplasmic adaptor subunit [Pseudoroseicyclus tamaricis]
MRFVGRAFLGIFLMALTVVLLVQAGLVLWGAVSERMNAEPRSFPQQERVVAANVVQVRGETIRPILDVYGELRSRRTLALRPNPGGTVTWVSEDFADGGQVEAGELLLRLDPVEAEAALARARADLADAEAEARDAERALTLARDELASAEEQAELRTAALERQQGLVDRGIVTQTELETAELAASNAQATVLSRRQALAQAEAAVDTGQNTIARTRLSVDEAERALAETEVTAPFTGVLASVTIGEGARISASEQVAELIDPDALEAAFRVSAAQYANLLDEDGELIAAPVTVALDVSGLTLEAEGRITRESAGGESQSGRLIYAEIGGAHGLRPGDFVTVSIAEPEQTQIARLPAAALAADGTVLALGEGNRLDEVSVALIRRQGDEVLIRAPDLEGEWVVRERSPLIGEGLRISPLLDSGEELVTGEEVAAAPEGFGGGGAGGPPGEGGDGAGGPPGEGGAGAASTGEMIALDEERRARLIAYLDESDGMPDAAKARIRETLAQPEVPAEMVARLESGMGI